MESGDGALATFFSSVLPNLSAEQSTSVTDCMKSLGVEDLDDMKYLQEADLIPVLKPIEARKVIAHFKAICEKGTSDLREETPRSLPDSPQMRSPEFSPRSSSCGYTSSSSSASATSIPCMATPLDNDWHYTFNIPWNKMPSEVTKKLEKKERPAARERREIIRLIVAEILIVCKTPGKKHLSEISRKMVLAYPKSFQDVIEGEVVGTGYDSITKQMVCRVENNKRASSFHSPKKQASSTSTSSSEVDEPPTKRKNQDSYGCINWKPARPPASESLESQNKHKLELQKMFKEGTYDVKKIEAKMTASFYSQRRDIVHGMRTNALLSEWPFLFEIHGVKIHFQELTGVDLGGDFELALTTKCERIYAFMKAKAQDKQKKLNEILSAMETSGSKTTGSILLLLEHFNEDSTKMFQHVDETCLPGEVNLDDLHSGPCIIVCGNSPLTASVYMCAVDGIIVNQHLPSFTDALLLMFSTYYCLNISYQTDLAATLEFLQRCIFRINPDKGTKVERNKKKKQQSVNPKVLSLISSLADFEWRE